MEISYVYDGSFEGLLTSVFHAYDKKEHPYTIAVDGNLQVIFGQRIVMIKNNPSLADRVEQGFRKKAGNTAYDNIWTAFLSCDPDKATKIYRYIRLGLKLGIAVHTHISHEDVLEIDKMCRYVGNESHLLKGFVRFSLMENGVFYSKITPKNNCIPILMPHFADRYNDQPFIIHDPGHNLAGVYDLKDWYMVETDDISLPELAEGELEIQNIWRSFYEAIAIKERKNLKLRMSHMPKRYWPNMTETLF